MELAALPMPIDCDPSPAGFDTDAEARLSIAAPAGTDMFHDPGGGARILNAPRAVGTPPAGDFQLSARVRVDFAQSYDAGVLLVWAGARHWAKLCFERSPQGDPMAVSVVTRELSDDANAFTVPAGQPLWLRVSRLGNAWAFHARTDGQPWTFVRHFSLDEPSPAAVGFEAQSPLGEGCAVTFDDIAFVGATLADLRSGV